MTNNAFEELRHSGKLPRPSRAGIKILELTGRDDSAAEELGEAVLMDSALTARILELANMAGGGTLEPVSTISEATARLGETTVRSVALGLSLISANRSGGCTGFDYDKYWSRSLARAVAAQSLSEATGIGDPAQAYVCGLLGEIGQLVFASVHPSEYSKVLSEASTGSEALKGLERERFEVDHDEVSAWLLAEWGFPAEFQSAVKGLANLADGPIGGLADILRHAQSLADLCLAGSRGRSPEERSHFMGELSAFKLSFEGDDAAFYELCDQVAAEWREWGEILEIPTRSVTESGAGKPSHSTAISVPGTPSTVTMPDVTNAPAATEHDLEVLLVDPDPRTRDARAKLLGQIYRVKAVGDAEAALGCISSVAPDIVVAAPQSNEKELCRALRRTERGRGAYLILLTGAEHVTEILEAGADDCVTEPANDALLLARMKTAERLTSLERQVERDRETMRTQAMQLARLTRHFRHASLTDHLTELPNRRFAMDLLQKQWAGVERTGLPMSVVLIDIDFFKKVNDEYGHEVGDIVLKDAAMAMRSRVRENEHLCRIGGEEFLIICQDGTTADQARICAERIRSTVERAVTQHDGVEHNVTVSMGVAQKMPDMRDPSALLNAADEAVSRAKDGGRNQVFVHGSSDDEKQTA